MYFMSQWGRRIPVSAGGDDRVFCNRSLDRRACRRPDNRLLVAAGGPIDSPPGHSGHFVVDQPGFFRRAGVLADLWRCAVRLGADRRQRDLDRIHLGHHRDEAALRLATSARRQSGHRQSSPSTGIGRRAVSAWHQQASDRPQPKAVPQREHDRRRAGVVSCGCEPNGFVTNSTLNSGASFISGSSPDVL